MSVVLWQDLSTRDVAISGTDGGMHEAASAVPGTPIPRLQLCRVNNNEDNCLAKCWWLITHDCVWSVLRYVHHEPWTLSWKVVRPCIARKNLGGQPPAAVDSKGAKFDSHRCSRHSRSTDPIDAWSCMHNNNANDAWEIGKCQKNWRQLKLDRQAA